MKQKNKIKCPCGSDDYNKCCGVFHKGKNATNALELMKSRYSAYALCNIDYIIKTTHPKNIDFTTNIQEWKKDIEDFCKYTDFQALEILEFTDGLNEAHVTFKAKLSSLGDDASFIEESKFLKEKGQWLYHSAKIS